ncbi:Phosphoglycerol transferase and related proteins, alkaline phosphatase superfamily [Klebsiella pneumoniae]|nr:Phosphoglycerol transferase and related proteins, alkaline phosphatase superfamily [Klebsiella pneumoniae]
MKSYIYNLQLFLFFKQIFQIIKNNFLNTDVILIIFLMTIPQFFFIFVDYFLDANRYYFVVEYYFCILFFFFKSIYLRVIGIFLYIFVFIFDIYNWIKQFFNFIRFEDLIYLTKFANQAPSIYLFYIFLLFVVLLTNVILVSLISVKLRSKRSLFCFLFFGIVFYFFYDYRGADVSTHRSTIGYWGSLIEYNDNLKYNYYVRLYNSKNNSFSKSKYPSILNEYISHSDKNVLFILNESWGSFDKKINNYILESIYKEKNYFKKINYGQSDFEGVTVQGELRELCQLTSTKLNFKDDIDENFDNCLPNKLLERGYVTNSFHVASGFMYDRLFWYSKAGLKNSIFFENMENKERCHSFNGGCDKNIIDTVFNSFNNRHKPVFTYWLTLNTHYPYDLADLEGTSVKCEILGLYEESEVCRNVKLHKQFFDRLMEKIIKDKINNITIIIVGDHMPPIINSSDKDMVNQGKVSWLYLEL